MNDRLLFKFLVIETILILVLAISMLLKPKQHVSNRGTSNSDTVYVNKPYKVSNPYKHITIPKTVFVFPKPDTVTIEKIVQVPGKITLNTNLGPIEYSNQFLGQYSKASKLLQLDSKDGLLNLTLFDTSGNINTYSYNFYPELYNYNYSYNYEYLTQKRKPLIKRVVPTGQVTIRPLSRMYDVDLGILYKTINTYYEIGLNTYYYPSIDNHFGIGPYIRVKYTFNGLWQK